MFKIKQKLCEAAMNDGAAAGAAGANAGVAPAAGAAPAANQSWFPEAHKGFVETKGWKQPADAIDSYVNLEKLIGADRAGRTVVLPKDETDVEGMKAFRSKLGVPETPDAYELPLPDGDSGELAKAAAQWMHKAGVPKAAAQEIAKNWNEHIAGMVTAAEQAAQQKSEQDLSELKAKWGAEFPKNEELARRDFRQTTSQAGLDDNDIKALEGAVGTAKMLKMFVELGKANAEPGFASNSNPAFGMSKAAAQLKINEITQKRAAGTISDKEWKDVYEAQMAGLHQVANGT